MNKRTCSIDGCDRPHRRGGYCDAHAQRAKRGADMLAPFQSRIADPAQALAARSTPGEGGCTLWIGPVNDSGYGLIKFEGRARRAHRYAWEQANGPIPDGAYVDHACHNRACVNVDHLRLATHAENEANRSGATVFSRTGVRGVSPHRNKYVAKVGNVYLGVYATVAEAARVVDAERARVYGEFAGR